MLLKTRRRQLHVSVIILSKIRFYLKLFLQFDHYQIKAKSAELTSANWLKMVKYLNKILAKFDILKKIMRLINKKNLYLASISASEMANLNSNQDFLPVD